MYLFKIEDFNPNYRQAAFDGEDIKGLKIYSEVNGEAIGTIDDVLVDESGRFRYFVIDTGFWVFGKKVLLPVGRCRVDPEAEKIYATGLVSKEQAEQLPEYHDSMTVDYDYEEKVRQVYRQRVSQPSSQAKPKPLSPKEATSYSYEQEPHLYQMNDSNHQRLRLYEEKLIADKQRSKTGEVTVGKRVETETASVSVPVEKEQVIIKRTQPSAKIANTPQAASFQAGEIAKIDVHAETPDIRKQAFLKEEVEVTKQSKQEVVETDQTLRKEELEIDIDGNLRVEK